MAIAKEVDFVSGVTPVSEAWLDLIQELLAGYVSPNFKLDIQSSTQVRVQAGNDHDSRAISVGGEFRRRDTNVSATVSGGAGVKSIYATADSADNLFALEVTGGAPAATKFRKIGEVDWSGSAITALRHEFPMNVHPVVSLPGDVPVGGVLDFAGAVPPSNYLLCVGGTVVRATYPALNTLFAASSYPYGAGDGSTTMGIPDLRRRFALGKADSGGQSTLGETGGSFDHTHTNPSTASGGSHSHTNSDAPSSGNHDHPTSNTGGALDSASSGGRAFNYAVAGSTVWHVHSYNATAAGAHTHNLASTGSGGAHTHTQGSTGTANPPYLVLNKIIRAA